MVVDHMVVVHMVALVVLAALVATEDTVVLEVRTKETKLKIVE